MLVKMETGASGGGGVDISDLIGNTYKTYCYLSRHDVLFLAGIKKIEVWTSNANRVYLYENETTTSPLFTINATHQEIDVSNYNVLFMSAADSQGTDFNIKVLE